jgi:branched-chain amino acid transport system substrate-binding protein
MMETHKEGIRMKKAIALALALGVAAVVAASAIAKTSGTASSAASASCAAPVIGTAFPLTGPAAFLGQEQLSWARYAVSRFNTQYRMRFRLKQGDTQLSASLARTVGRQMVADRSVLGVNGASTSQGVVSSAGLFKNAALASVSPSATRADLTTGKFPTFFRVVPNDVAQARTIVGFVADTLKVRSVVVIDSQDDYSVPLANGVQRQLRAKNVRVQRASVAATDTDFSSIVTTVPNDARIVVFATQTASAANTLANQLREQGKQAVVLGTDGAFSPDQFKPRSGYVSSFAPDIRGIAAQRALVRGYNRFSNNKTFGTFGPPSYLATWVLMDAVRKACADGRVTRSEVTAQVRRTNMRSILGGTLRFTRRGDVIDPLPGGKFYMFKITNGRYTNA